VTPESVREVQPLVVGETVVVADARIDNRSELVADLGLGAGEWTDVELIHEAYRAWGVESAARLVGDFAFVVWDGERRRVYGARDALGMRSLVYRLEAGRTLFATEVKQILAVPGVPARIFEPAVGVYLSGPYMPPEWTFYEGIERLGPAHALVVERGEKRVWRYWDVDPGHRIRYRREEEYAEHFLEVFREAVRARLRSVHPVGLLLSGGVDSGSVAAVAGSLLRSGEAECPEFRAYSFAFEELVECDERAVSGPLAEHWGIPVTGVPADDLWPLKDYPDHGPDRDDPYLFVYQPLLDACLDAARADGCALVLSGDRGDLMAGEPIYDLTSLLWKGRWTTLLREMQTLAGWQESTLRTIAARQLWRPMRQELWPPDRAPRLRRLAGRLRGRERRSPGSGQPSWLLERWDGLDRDAIRAQSEGAPSDLGIAASQRYRSVFSPMHMWGVGWSERMSALRGVGFADAWSDRRLLEFVLAIPQRVLNTVGDEKRLVRRAVSPLVPPRVRSALGKTDPYPLFNRALRARAAPTIQHLFTASRAAHRGWLDSEALEAHYRSVRDGAVEQDSLWWAISTEAWLRAFHDPVASGADGD
jgi:asparagine synthase (glutamine-hydrolysing)